MCLEKGDNKKLKSKNAVRKLVGGLSDQYAKRAFTDHEARAAKISEFFTSFLTQKTMGRFLANRAAELDQVEMKRQGIAV